jgi:hypothetical protein
MPDGCPPSMTPARYRAALKAMRISQRELARMLKCSIRLTSDWGVGRLAVPPGVAFWLEECMAILEANPLPKPPRDWRRRDPRYSLRRLKARNDAKREAERGITELA